MNKVSTQKNIKLHNTKSTTVNHNRFSERRKTSSENFTQSESSLNETDEKRVLVIATDSEWHAPDKSWIATTFATSQDNFIFIRESIPTEIKQSIEVSCHLNGIYVEFTTMTDSTCLLNKVLELVNSRKSLENYDYIKLLIFYTPKDLEYSLSWEKFRNYCITKGFAQKRNISTPKPIPFEVEGRNLKLLVKDLKGWAEKGLKDLAEAVGVEMCDKGAMDEYKSRMLEGLLDMPEQFVAYSIDDSKALIKIYSEFMNLVRWLQHDIIGLDEESCFTESDIPMTVGSLVAGTLEKWLYTKYHDKELLQVAVRKLGLLDADDNRHPYFLTCFHHVRKRYRNREKLKKALIDGTDSKLKDFLNVVKFEHLAYSQAGVRYFAGVKHDSSAFSALVQGGRCNNERPSEYVVKYGADIDLQSCYGSALRSFIYPLGLPTITAYTCNQDRITLKQWLDRNKNDLVDNLWTITVEANLSFPQDLIYSKLVSQYDINRASFDFNEKDIEDDVHDDDIAHIPADFGLIRKQIRRGIITSDILNAIRNVATNTEWGEFMRLKVVTAVAYLKSNRVDTTEEWIDAVLACRGEIANKNGIHGKLEDTRTRAWVGIPLEDFVGKLVDERNSRKKAEKECSNQEEKHALTSEQKMLKLFVNVTYGALASPYFPIGNTVVANNITARARLGAWMLNKALHTRESITDGGMYCLMEVPTLRSQKRPGFQLLADNTKWKKRELFRQLAPLAGRDWVSEFDQMHQQLMAIDNQKNREQFLKTKLVDLDALAETHIKEFWDRYGLELPFKIEHKIEHTYLSAAYINKAHYLFRTLLGTEVYKIRGCKKFTDKKLRKHPTYKLLTNMADGNDEFPDELDYDQHSIIKIGKWIEAQNSSEDAYKNIKALRPGDELIEARTARYNNTHILCDTEAEFKRRKDRKSMVRGKKVEWFERYRNLGISKVIQMMLEDSLEVGDYAATDNLMIQTV